MQIVVDAATAFIHVTTSKLLHIFAFLFKVTTATTMKKWRWRRRRRQQSNATIQENTAKCFSQFLWFFSSFFSIVCNLIQIFNIPKKVNVGFFCSFFQTAHQNATFYFIQYFLWLTVARCASQGFFPQLNLTDFKIGSVSFSWIFHWKLVALSTRMNSSYGKYDVKLVFATLDDYFHLISYYYPR